MEDPKQAKERVDSLSKEIKRQLEAKLHSIRTGKFPPNHFGPRAIIVR